MSVTLAVLYWWCFLYEAQNRRKNHVESENGFISELEKIDPNLGFVHVSKSKSLNTKLKKKQNLKKKPSWIILEIPNSIRETIYFSA